MRDLKRVFVLLFSILVANTLYSEAKDYLLNFNELKWGSQVSDFPLFDSGQDSVYGSLLDFNDLSRTDFSEYSYQSNGYGGTSLVVSAGSESCVIESPVIDYGQKFTLEIKLKASSLTSSGLDIYTDLDQNNQVKLKWFIDGNKYMKVTIMSQTIVSAQPLSLDSDWVSFQLEVNLGRFEAGEVVQLYKDEQPIEIAGSSNQFPNTNISSSSKAYWLKSLTTQSMEIDFLRILSNIQQNEEVEFYPGEMYLKEGESLTLLVNGSKLMQRVQNDSKDFYKGSLKESAIIKYDTNLIPAENEFNGIFEIPYAIKADQFNGSVKVEVSLLLQGHYEWKKITEQSLSLAGKSGLVESSVFWDSRNESFDWQGIDIQARKIKHAQIKMVLR